MGRNGTTKTRKSERGTRNRRGDLRANVPRSVFRVMFRSMSVQAIAWSPTGAVRIIDQRALPEARLERDLEGAEAVAEAIRTLQVRGAPLIGIAAAMGLVAGTRELRGAPREQFLARLGQLVELLAAARPTAVNLRWALDRMASVAAALSGDGSALWERLQAEATAIWEEDRAMSRRIGEAGLPLVPDGAKVLTHCNAGALATGGIGTALAPIYLAHEAGRTLHIFVDETRPVLQGARLTAWELSHAGIRCTLIADAAAGSLMRQAKVDLVLVGADRIAVNGDFANKIGTYPLAVLARHHGVPFYCAAPSSTIDASLQDGDGIPIEQRSPDEVKTVAGRPAAPEALRQAGQVPVALGITNQRETVCVWERDSGRPLHRAIVWQDRRTARRCAQLVKQRKAALIRERTGLIVDPYFSATKIEWLRERVPGLARRVAAGEAVFGTIDTWLLFRLTNGQSYATDHTNASRTMLYNITAHAWDDVLLGLFGVRRDALPEIRGSSGAFGVCAAEHLGAEIPIAGIAGDQQAALFGQGCVAAGQAKNTYGTGAFLLLNTGKRRAKSPAPRSMRWRSAPRTCSKR